VQLGDNYWYLDTIGSVDNNQFDDWKWLWISQITAPSVKAVRLNIKNELRKRGYNTLIADIHLHPQTPPNSPPESWESS
jgi:hypothetical protein